MLPWFGRFTIAYKKARKLICTHFQLAGSGNLVDKNSTRLPSLYVSAKKLNEYKSGWQTRDIISIYYIFQILLTRYKHKLPSTARISPRTIEGKNTKNLELQNQNEEFSILSINFSSFFKYNQTLDMNHRHLETINAWNIHRWDQTVMCIPGSSYKLEREIFPE